MNKIQVLFGGELGLTWLSKIKLTGAFTLLVLCLVGIYGVSTEIFSPLPGIGASLIALVFSLNFFADVFGR